MLPGYGKRKEQFSNLIPTFDPRWRVLLGSESREAHLVWSVGWQESALDQKDIFRSHPCDLMVWFYAKERWEGPSGKFFTLRSTS